MHTLPSGPNTGATGGAGDFWFMDSGASSHMTPYPGNLSSSTPITTSSSIAVGNGHTLPITLTGSTTFPSNSRPLSLHNVIVSPALVQNLLSVKRLARDNSVTVEFDDVSFSVKDGHTRMLLHRCDSPGDAVYPVQSTSTATSHLALSAGVDL
jgi:hypothetical protein